MQSSILNDTLDDLELLKEVINYKDKFYRIPRAKYEEILNGNLKLVPAEGSLEFFTKDYNSMINMLFGNIPTFEEILSNLKLLENLINEKINQNNKIKVIVVKK